MAEQQPMAIRNKDAARYSTLVWRARSAQSLPLLPRFIPDCPAPGIFEPAAVQFPAWPEHL